MPMPTNALERLEARTIKAKQAEARGAQAIARVKEIGKTTRHSMLRAGRMYALPLDELQKKLVFLTSLDEHAAANALDVDELYRELLAVARRKTRREPAPIAVAAE